MSDENRKKVNLYIDCEWDGYRGGLLSIALVGDEINFHATMINQTVADPWVREHVVPNLFRWAPERAISDSELSYCLSRFFADQLFEGASVHIIADWPEDIERFCRALIVGPGQRIETPPLTFEIIRAPDGAVVPICPHNAYSDAEALQKWHSGEQR